MESQKIMHNFIEIPAIHWLPEVLELEDKFHDDTEWPVLTGNVGRCTPGLAESSL